MDLIHAGVLSCVRNLLIMDGNTKKTGLIHEPNATDIEEIYRLHEQFWHTRPSITTNTIMTKQKADPDGQQRLF